MSAESQIFINQSKMRENTTNGGSRTTKRGKKESKIDYFYAKQSQFTKWPNGRKTNNNKVLQQNALSHILSKTNPIKPNSAQNKAKQSELAWKARNGRKLFDINRIWEIIWFRSREKRTQNEPNPSNEMPDRFC